MKDQRGVVYLETLVAFLPVFLFFLATLQIADLSAAHILVRHAATVAARAAVVVLPDDGRFYNDEDNQQLHAFDGLRRQDIELAADRIMRANSRLDAAASNVVIGFQRPPQRPDPPKDRFGCDNGQQAVLPSNGSSGGGGEPCMSREDVLAEAFKAETAGELLDTSTKGEGDWGMREKLDALVTAKYRCLIRFLCPRDYTMVATASLLYQGARYTYEAWPDSIRSDSRPEATPAAPVSPATPGGPAAPADPSDPDTPIADQTPPTNPEASEPVANAPPGSTRPPSDTTPPGSGTTPGSSTPNPPPTAAPGSSTGQNPVATAQGSSPAANPSPTSPGNPVVTHPSATPPTAPVASGPPQTSPSGPNAIGSAPTNPSSPVVGNPSPTRPNAPVASAPDPSGPSQTPPTGNNAPSPSRPASPPTGASSSQGATANNATGSHNPQGTTTPGMPAGNGPNAGDPNGAVASNTGSNASGPAPNTAPGSTATNGSSLTSNNTGSRTPSSGSRPSIVAREPSEDTATLTAPDRLAQGDTAAADSSNGDPGQASAHGATTPAAPGGNAQNSTNTASNGRVSASNPTRGPAPTRGPPGATTDTQGVIASAITSEDGTSPTIPRSNNSNAPDSTATIIASGPDGITHAANSGNRAPRNLADLRAQLPSDLRNVPIVRDPSLTGNAVRAHYTYDARGRVTSVEIRVGPNAQPRHIADHVNTVRTMQGYQGLSGRIRLALDRLNAWIAGHPHVRPGSLAWETRQEVEKLRAIVDARLRALDGANLSEAQRTELENERQQYTRQLARHEANLTQITNEPGRGYVAAEDATANGDEPPNIDPQPCFVAGTLIRTPAGPMSIETIAAGQEVFAYDTTRKMLIVSRVTRTFVRGTSSLVDLTVRHDDTGAIETVTGTSEHPFYLPVLGSYIGMGELAVGDLLQTDSGGGATILGVAARAADVPVFNFEVEALHNYFVAPPGSEQSGLLVHNTCGDHGGRGRWRYDGSRDELTDAEKQELDQLESRPPQTVEELERLVALRDKAGSPDTDAGSPEHMLARWRLKLQTEPVPPIFSAWRPQYRSAMHAKRIGDETEARYREAMRERAKGEDPICQCTIEVYVTDEQGDESADERRMDMVAAPQSGGTSEHYVEIKGGDATLDYTGRQKLELQRDAELAQMGIPVTWVFEAPPSGPLVAALARSGISVVIRVDSDETAARLLKNIKAAKPPLTEAEENRFRVDSARARERQLASLKAARPPLSDAAIARGMAKGDKERARELAAKMSARSRPPLSDREIARMVKFVQGTERDVLDAVFD